MVAESAALGGGGAGGMALRGKGGQGIEQACYWLAHRPERAAAPLVGTRNADVAVVGAGFTGLWTALFVKELDPEAEVVVVEQGVVGYGASGRNAGMLWDTVDHSHELAIAHFGAAEARRLAQLGERNVAELEAFLAARGIACDYEPTGRLLVATTPAHLDAFRRAAEIARGLGLATYQPLDKRTTRAEVQSPLYVGGLAIAAGGILDPVKLIDALRLEAERLGVTVYERSHVVGLEPMGSGVRLRTARGRVDARRAVLATNAYTHRLVPRVSRRMIPMYGYMMVSEPLTPAQRDIIGWPHRQAVADGRVFFNYARLTADDRVLWGSADLAYFPRNRVDARGDHSAAHYEALRVSFRHYFRALGDLEWAYAWGGPIGVTTRLTPFFGNTLEGRVLYGLGYSGRGLGTTRLAGRVLAHLALERSEDLLELPLVQQAPFRYPPEPARRWVVRAVGRALRRADRSGERGPLLRVLDRLGVPLAFHA
jgi:glycine/D-amino acid oxidase-like deaminating enzyme